MPRIIKHHEQNPLLIERTLTPFAGLHKIFNDTMRDLYQISGKEQNLANFEHHGLFPSMDIIEAKDHYSIELEMPGMDEKDIEVIIDNNRLTIKGEKSSTSEEKEEDYVNREIRYGSYERSIELPSAADVNKISANFKKGILCVRIPKNVTKNNNARKVKIDKEK